MPRGARQDKSCKIKKQFSVVGFQVTVQRYKLQGAREYNLPIDRLPGLPVKIKFQGARYKECYRFIVKKTQSK